MQDLVLTSFSLSDLQSIIKEAIRTELLTGIKASAPAPADGYLTRKETAQWLNISLPTLHEWTLSGKLPAYRIGSRVLYKKTEVDNAPKQIRVTIR